MSLWQMLDCFMWRKHLMTNVQLQLQVNFQLICISILNIVEFTCEFSSILCQGADSAGGSCDARKDHATPKKGSDLSPGQLTIAGLATAGN